MQSRERARVALLEQRTRNNAAPAAVLIQGRESQKVEKGEELIEMVLDGRACGIGDEG
jgi:hypothetical protein